MRLILVAGLLDDGLLGSAGDVSAACPCGRGGPNPSRRRRTAPWSAPGISTSALRLGRSSCRRRSARFPWPNNTPTLSRLPSTVPASPGAFGGIALVRQRLEADADGNSVGQRGGVVRPRAAADDKAGESDARGEQQFMRVLPSSGLAEPLIKKFRPRGVLHRTRQANRDRAAVPKPFKDLAQKQSGPPGQESGRLYHTYRIAIKAPPVRGMVLWGLWVLGDKRGRPAPCRLAFDAVMVHFIQPQRPAADLARSGAG